jgi:hypothetical protein
MNLVWHYEVLPQWWLVWRGRKQTSSHDTNSTIHVIAYIRILCYVVDLLWLKFPKMPGVVQFLLAELLLVVFVGVIRSFCITILYHNLLLFINIFHI